MNIATIKIHANMNRINDTIVKLKPVSAESAAKRLKQFITGKVPTEPWLHVIAYSGCIIWYIWDTREIVHVESISDQNTFARIVGEVSKCREVRDNRTCLLDSSKLLRSVSASNQKLNRLLS